VEQRWLDRQPPPDVLLLPSLIPLVFVALLLLGGGAEPTFGALGDLYQPGAGLLDGLSGPPLLIGGTLCVAIVATSIAIAACYTPRLALHSRPKRPEIKITAARSVLGDEDFAAAVRHGEAQGLDGEP
jgi:hypothetical protein